MNLERNLEAHKDKIVGAGLLMGILVSSNIIPLEEELFGLVKGQYVALGIIAAAGYVFYTYYLQKKPKTKSLQQQSIFIQPPQPARFPEQPPQPPVQQPVPQQPAVQQPPAKPVQPPKPSRDIYKEFNNMDPPKTPKQ